MVLNDSTSMQFQILTWNVANTQPLQDNLLDKLLVSNIQTDIYIIGLQEIPTGIIETAKSFLEYDGWAKLFMSKLVEKNYYMVESIRMQGMSLSMFTLVKHLPYMRFIKTALERTGFGGNWGNKGGVAISCWIYGKKFCFLNTHLIPHRQNSAARVEQFKYILDKMMFGDYQKVMSHDCVFWLGDLNFRLNDLPQSDVVESIRNKQHIELLDFDQLGLERLKEPILQEFKEAAILFPPTYKFDIGTDIYDTSHKKRVPSWTDRIMYRCHPDLQCNMLSSTNMVEQVEGSYINYPEIKQSDHKPVSSQYNVYMAGNCEKLVSIEIIGDWLTSKEGVIKVQLNENFCYRYFDYIALYKAPICNARSYNSWIYMPNVEHSLPGQLEFQLEFPRVETAGSYVIGYYSEIQNCLLAVSPVFSVNS